MTTKTLKRAIVADDHPVVIKGIQSFLEQDGAIRVVATARDTLELAEAVDTTPCDFVFSDIGMRGIDGESSSIAFLRRLAWQERRPKVIVLTMISQTRMLAGLVQLGVDGLIDKRDGLEYLRDAMLSALCGRRPVWIVTRPTVRLSPTTTKSTVVTRSPRHCRWALRTRTAATATAS